jgi:hypothetical protein
MDATVRFLSRGTVTPIEIFGYASPAAPDADFAVTPGAVFGESRQHLFAACARR